MPRECGTSNHARALKYIYIYIYRDTLTLTIDSIVICQTQAGYLRTFVQRMHPGVEKIRIAVNLLFIHLPELLVVATCKSQTSEQTKDIPEVNEREHGPLSYLMGSVISKMFRTSKFRMKSMLESALTNKKNFRICCNQ
jgi:hypothetical protein